MKNGELRLKSGSKAMRLVNLFYNPYQPTIDDYYEPWNYDYETLTNSPSKQYQPVARPKSSITGEWMELSWGPNWEDDLAGAHVTGLRDPNVVKMEQSIQAEFENVFMMYLPRICEHCLNPSCVSSCPSDAMYKRDEDGIVLVDQNACRAWRYCVTSCPYKKVYFNWQTNKAEKCTLCFPRIEAGMPTICSETCVGRIRYIGVILYDADKVKEAASVEDEKQLYHAQLDIFLDPNDPAVAAAAKEAGIPDEWITAAQRSPIYKMIVDWKIALPLHPEYRTLPMVWYIPPLSPIINTIEGKGSSASANDIFPAIDNMRIPIEYLANLLTAGDTAHIRTTLKKMAAMRSYMRAKQTNKQPDIRLIESLGLSREDIEEMYRLLAIAKYEDRFVIPASHREEVADLYAEQGSCGLAFAGGPGACGTL
ncbi:nitrate reductase subunit beta [Geobacillus sp. GHH01]|nr:nitrate reductase subunit beta [Geobacillus sp. GHH01]